MPDLVDADPVGTVIAFLNANSAVLEALGGSGRIGLLNKPPYPCLGVVDTPGGSDRNLRWLIAPEITLNLWGDLDGSPGKAELRRIMYVVLQELRDLPERPTEPGHPVVTSVESTGAVGWAPEPTGQGKYTARIQIYMHPPVSEATP